MKNIILDFDGTLTDAWEEAIPYFEHYAEEVSERTGIDIEKLKEKRDGFEDDVKNDPLAGWEHNGNVIAPASSDPYILNGAIYEKVLDFRYGRCDFAWLHGFRSSGRIGHGQNREDRQNPDWIS